MTHTEIATACLSDPTLLLVSGPPIGKRELKASLDKAHGLICMALADQRRAELRETANRLAAFDGTPHRPKEPKT